MNYLKTTIILINVIVFATLLLKNTQNVVSAEDKSIEVVTIETPKDYKELNINLRKSYVNFVGSRPLGNHYGQFKLSEGGIQVKKNRVIGGAFTIDISSLHITDAPEILDEESKAKLAGHLLSADFFDMEKYPSAHFTITEVEPYSGEVPKENKVIGVTNPSHIITGDLEMMGITQSVTFTALMNESNHSVKAEAIFDINRSDWGMAYGTDESLGDKFISPMVRIVLSIETAE